MAWAKRKPWIAGGIALGVVGALVLGVVLLFSGGVSPQEMERHVANYYKPESVVCDSRGNDRFYCSLTATYQDGQEHCEGAVLVEYQTWAEDDFIQVAGYGDFSSQTYGCYPREG